jgi:hypothetical protein
VLSAFIDVFANTTGNPRLGLKVLLVWVLVALLIVVWGSRRRSRPGTRPEEGDPRLLPGTSARATPLWLLVMVVFGVSYALLILSGANFAEHDHDFLTLFSVRGEMLSPLIWPGEGRFFPLGQQEFNVLQFLTRTCQGYHLFAIGQLIALLALVYALLDDLRVPHRLAIMGSLLIVPSFLICFSGLIFPERNVLFALVVMAFCLRRYPRSRSPVDLVGALLAAHLALYCKETSSVLLLCFAGARVLLSWRLRRPKTRASVTDFCTENQADLGILVLTALFFLLYAVIMVPSASMGYAETHRASSGGLSLLVAYLRMDLLAGVFAAVVIVRLVTLLRRPEGADPLWDPLALGALAWFAAFVVLGMLGPYYLAPVDLVAVLYLGRIVAQKRPMSLATSLLVAVVTAQNLMGSVYHTVERKNIMQAKAQAAYFIRDFARSSPRGPVHLFFPHATSYQVMEFGAFLSHIGVEIVEDGGLEGSGAAAAVLESPREFPTGTCVDYRDQIACRQVSRPTPGTLVVHLPDDAPPPGVIARAADPSDVMFSYQPFGVSDRTKPLLSMSRGVSFVFRSRPLPASWLTARITSTLSEGPDAGVSALRRSGVQQ